jgi:hypothetical protein
MVGVGGIIGGAAVLIVRHGLVGLPIGGVAACLVVVTSLRRAGPGRVDLLREPTVRADAAGPEGDIELLSAPYPRRLHRPAAHDGDAASRPVAAGASGGVEVHRTPWAAAPDGPEDGVAPTVRMR